MNNIGLALRWEAGLAEMERLAVTPDEDRQVAVEEWASAVTAMVQAEPWLDAWCVERSIISIRLRRSPKVNDDNNNNDDDSDHWLNMSELREVYRCMSQDVMSSSCSLRFGQRLSSHVELSLHEKLVLSSPIHLGQPVDVSDSFAILRVALGVESLVQYLQNPAQTLAQDQIAIQKLALMARHWSTC